MPDKKSKTQKVDEAFEKADKVADAIKAFTPDAVDAEIEAKKELVKTGWGLAKMFGGLFGGKFKKKNKVQ